MNRRNLLTGLGGLAGLSLLGTWIWGPGREAIIKAIIEEAIAPFEVEPKSMEQFAHDFLQKTGWSSAKMQVYHWMPQRLQKEEVRAFVVRQFVLSSTLPKAGETRLCYRAMYDPYQQVCHNPFFDQNGR